jgi:ATP-binding protein involved in chromosome partitioning
MDPRVASIGDRLEQVSRVIGVTGSKGGIGKSVVAASTALALASRNRRVGLFDLDFTSPSDHVILGFEVGLPSEEYGIDPHRVAGIELMSVAFFAGDAAAPLRGEDATNVLLELLAITRWSELDVLVLDLPPGLGDTTLDVIRLVPRAEYLVVGTASALAIGSLRRALALLTELSAPVVGIVENMQRENGSAVRALAAEYHVPFLGAVPFDPGLEAALGDVEALAATRAFAALTRLAEVISPDG